MESAGRIGADTNLEAAAFRGSIDDVADDPGCAFVLRAVRIERKATRERIDDPSSQIRYLYNCAGSDSRMGILFAYPESYSRPVGTPFRISRHLYSDGKSSKRSVRCLFLADMEREESKMVTPLTNTPHTLPVTPAAVSGHPSAQPKQEASGPGKPDAVHLSNAAQAALQEASETPAQTAKEAGCGDMVAKRLLIKEQAAQAAEK